MTDLTHYVPYFTQNLRGATARHQVAVCGAFVTPEDHSAEPACETCVAWLQKDAEDDRPLSSEICQDCRQRFDEPHGWCLSCKSRKPGTSAA